MEQWLVGDLDDFVVAEFVAGLGEDPSGAPVLHLIIEGRTE
jgi:hypothetical protein